ncbi:MAG: nitrilase-related carbon-nitrogen hydrolase [Pirellulaceae bacterium]
MQIVAVQLEIAWQDKLTNHARVRELLTGADIQPGSLIVLPEMFDTGFSMDLAVTAQDETRVSEALLKEMAIHHASTVIGGVVGPIIDGVASNEAVAFSPEGKSLVRYRKQQPFSLVGEHLKYGRGDGPAKFMWNGVHVAPFICYDLRFPELFRGPALDGAELLLVIACWPAVRSEHWVRLLQARAIENLCLTVGVNRCGGEPNLPFDGRSCGFDQMGQPLFEAGSEEAVMKFDIDIDAVRRWREKFPALRDARL